MRIAAPFACALVVAFAACGKPAPAKPSAATPPARLLPLPRPDDAFSVTATSSVDGRTVTAAGNATVRWQWSADASDGTELLRIEGLLTELWWRSPTGLAVWTGEDWFTVEGVAPTGPPVSANRGQLNAALTVEQPLGSGDRVDGCLRLRIAGRPEGSGEGERLTRAEERTLCPDRGETVIERTWRGPLGERVERLLRR